jgi:hypothetical protein
MVDQYGMRDPTKLELFQAKLVVKDPQARSLFNPEVVTNRLA